MVGDITRQNHLDNGLPHTPVLGLTQQLKDIVLRIEEQFESDSTVMVLKDRLVIIAKSFGMSHGNEEWIIDTRVLNITQEACQESRHDIEVTEMLHYLSLLDKVVEVAC